MTPTDDLARIELAAATAGELLRLLDGLAGGPAGRHLRRLCGPDGLPLFEPATSGRREVWAAVALVDLIRGLRRAAPAGECDGCGGNGCKGCRMAGYVPTDLAILAQPAAERHLPTMDVSDVWGAGENL